MPPLLLRHDPVVNRVFEITFAGPGSCGYAEHQRLSFPKEASDDDVAFKMKMDADSSTFDLKYTGKTEGGEWMFARHMDGIYSATVVRMKEILE